MCMVIIILPIFHFLLHPAIAIDKNRFVIGKIDLEAGRTYGWLSILANKTGKDFKIYVDQNGTTQVMTVPL